MSQTNPMVTEPMDLRSHRSAACAGVLVRADTLVTSTPHVEEGTVVTHPFLDLAPLSAARFASIEDRVARLLGTGQDVVIMQGEALLPLEGAIRATAGPGTTALNVITGPYGQTFGDWLRDCGATVIDLVVPFHTAVTATQIREAFTAHPEIDFVSLVHAEAATGTTNPVAEIGAVVREQGAPFYLDAVASVGAEKALPDAWGVDLCVIGAQKAMGGPAGVSAVSVSERAWAGWSRTRERRAARTSRCWTGSNAGWTAVARPCRTRRHSWRCSAWRRASSGSRRTAWRR